MKNWRTRKAHGGQIENRIPCPGMATIPRIAKRNARCIRSSAGEAKAQEAETLHGKVAEAEFRKWLSGFLPKRYEVTPGYLISPGLKSTQKSPHFDVIIYDKLESPVLWVEDSPDSSIQGRSLAIPVEYVRAVLEVKAKFSSSTVGDAVEHLADLLPLMSGLDEPQEKYKLYLPSTFFCGLVFFELLQEMQFSEAALNKIIAGMQLRGFFGGLILRGEGHVKDLTGRLSLLRSETEIPSTVDNNKQSLLNFALSKSVKVTDALHFGAVLTWTETHFSQFSFDAIAMLQGKYEVGRLSSFHGMGTSEWEQSQKA
jgi:hypothetical protein